MIWLFDIYFIKYSVMYNNNRLELEQIWRIWPLGLLGTMSHNIGWVIEFESSSLSHRNCPKTETPGTGRWKRERLGWLGWIPTDGCDGATDAKLVIYYESFITNMSHACDLSDVWLITSEGDSVTPKFPFRKIFSFPFRPTVLKPNFNLK